MKDWDENEVWRFRGRQTERGELAESIMFSARDVGGAGVYCF